MILSGKEIERELGKNIVIDPFDPAQVNPNSYNLKLDNKLYIYKSALLDMKRNEEVQQIMIPEEGIELRPHVLYLGQTVEYTETNNYVPMLEGRSSIGRLGLFIHVSAGFGDVGFAGRWTLEMYCTQPLRVYPFVQICQIFYHTIQGDYKPYSAQSKYQNSDSVLPSKLYTELN